VIYIGIDVGSVGIKAAAIGSSDDTILLTRATSLSNGSFSMDGEIDGKPVLLSKYKRVMGEPARMTFLIISELMHCLPNGSIGGIRITGASGQSLAKSLDLGYENEFNSVVCGVGAQYPKARTIIEMGGNSSKYIRLVADGERRAGILDYEKNGDCAAGTGSFMDQQASRLRYAVEEIGDLVLSVEASPTIAGRCTVFSKTDMVHAQQRGYTPAQILKGLCEAVVRNFKGTVTKGKSIVPPVVLVGGMAANSGIVQAIQNIFELKAEDLIVSKTHAWMGAIGAGLYEAEVHANETPTLNPTDCLERLQKMLGEKQYAYPGSPPLSMQNLMLLRDQTKSYSFEGRATPVDAYLGIDVGSVSTNLAVLDESGALIHSSYQRTDSRPIEVVRSGLLQIQELLADKIRIRGVGTTGSGRELIGAVTGADVIHDEITAHKTGAVFVAKVFLGSDVDTIFEIGGQDAKFIRLEKGIVVDFSMNEACSAGTGSFLEEQAERLGIRIEEEFASMALKARKPTRLGERCTVFMEKDLINLLKEGVDKSDLAAGLAYSIALNYLNRVVRGRKIGDLIFFQGGTAYNDAVAAAFSNLLKKQIVVPPYNGVIGAIGAALLAHQKIRLDGIETRFRGYDLSQVDYELRERVCHACSNSCAVQEIRVEGERTYWGDKCSNRFRHRPKTSRRPVIPDLVALREKLLQDDGLEQAHGPRIGMPRSMYFYDFFPFWHTYFNKIGCTITVSEPTNRKLVENGIEAAMAEPCFPIQVAHGHVYGLKEQNLDYIFVPNVISTATQLPETTSYLCPWGQTLSFVLASARALSGVRDRMLMPTIRFQEGIQQVKRSLAAMATTLGVSRKQSNQAVQLAFKRQREFAKSLIDAGRQALQELDRSDQMGIVMLARPYTLYDPGSNLDIPRKLRDVYGVNLIPMDFLDLNRVDIRSMHENMFWDYGRRILQAAQIVGDYPRLHIIYMTNFKCGPDSFINHYVGSVSHKPFLALQLDGHGNDAGAITRCEAYLESKGFL
jgi:predicted CoA-substrate-specific enzyme activase